MSQGRNSRDTQSAHRDWLRMAARAVGLEDLVAPLDVIDELTRWVLGLPWAIELPPTGSDSSIRRFAIDCPPLDCQAVWLLIGSFEDPALPDEIHVALPNTIASIAVAVGWATPAADANDGCLLVGVTTPTTNTELRGLQAVLQLAYQYAFPPPDALQSP
jgi:hypothetical protein